ncbi:PREDICTED: LOW QUALITY PROTEIN: DNA excision repair protein ERCC-6-like [Branchiostoma belcheri]|uniref:DNA excision repair protein ERCC-6 n=1 Tax=Branchiostoma belcheri TaxID=7741 RepID=A0A6P4ZN92_BRABE|nr:PREDICTED: LOW QUALITY PROTEIN: DNA excision repair protein ERCC-6-like [Branchiostoma belcheri]
METPLEDMPPVFQTGVEQQEQLNMEAASNVMDGLGSLNTFQVPQPQMPLQGNLGLGNSNDVDGHLSGFHNLQFQMSGQGDLGLGNSTAMHDGFGSLNSFYNPQLHMLGQGNVYLGPGNNLPLEQPMSSTVSSDYPGITAALTGMPMTDSSQTPMMQIIPKLEPVDGASNFTLETVNSNEALDDDAKAALELAEALSKGITTGKPSGPSMFSIDTSQIQAVAPQDQASELQGLGVDVYNQETLEHGIMCQVDLAVQAEMEQKRKASAERELKNVLDDIRSVKQEVTRMDRAISGLPASFGLNNRDVQRRVDSIKRQKENKLKQLKKLRAKHKKLMNILGGDTDEPDVEEEEEPDPTDNVSALEGLMSGANKQETERERLIRTGQITPFDPTPATADAAKPRGPKKIVTDVMSDFEKYLAKQDQLSKQKKKIVKQKQVKTKRRNDSEDPETPTKKNKTSKKMSNNEKGRRRQSLSASEGSADSPTLVKSKSAPPKLKRESPDMWNDSSNSSSPRIRKGNSPRLGGRIRNSDDSDVSGGGWSDSDDEYVPSKQEMKDSWLDDVDIRDLSDDASEKKKAVKRKSKHNMDYSGLAGPHDSSGEDEEEEKQKKSQHRCRDDGNLRYFHKRLRQNHKEKLRQKQVRQEAGEDSESEASDVEMDGGFKLPGETWNKLYKYQQTGVRWLWELHSQQAGGIMGDEMGLGKTIQAIVFLYGLHYGKVRNRGIMTKYIGLGPVMIVAPVTVLHQWVREFHTWFPRVRVAILHESGTFTTSKDRLIREIARDRGVLVTSYQEVNLRQDSLLHYDWHYVILDEGHKIRNPDAKVTLACKQFRTPHRIILSGSPMQNNLRELWSLCDFVFPGKLGTLPVFMEQFSVPITQGGYANATPVQVQTAYKCACVLRDTINPYLLRRMKNDVKMNLNLPNKSEQVLFCRITEEQKEAYKDYLGSRECQQILDGQYQVFAGLITLRKICNHPDLVTGGPRIMVGTDESTLTKDQHYGYWKRSGKMIVVNTLLKMWHKQGHRVLLFSQSKQMLDLMEEFVQDQNYTYMRMDGTTTISSRQPKITKFNKDTSIFVFLLTTRVGGLGVNLTGANRVIIFDPDWNPSTDMQARERAWRIGQNQDVTIYRLLTTGTIEEKIYHRQIFKQFLTNRVLKDPRQRRFFKSNDMYELFTLTCDDNKEGTETGAIFAGTGSEVKVDTRKVKIAEKVAKPDGKLLPRRKEKTAEKRSSPDSPKDKATVSRLLAKWKLGNSTLNSVMKKVSANGEESGSSPVCNGDEPSESNSKEQRSNGDNKTLTQETQELNQVTTSQSNIPEKSTIVAKLVTGASTRACKPSTSHERGKKLKKKKRKDAALEGERIQYLARHSAYRSSAQEEEASHKATEDYVLKKLFKKSGVHSALQHDKIMMSSNPDYLLVEGEADRVAKEAARTLKRTRQQCLGASSGVPTWTGRHGGSGAPPGVKQRPRFGKKKTSAAAGACGTGKPEAKAAKFVIPKKKHFSGHVAGTKSASEDVSSESLLNQMRLRNHMKLSLEAGNDSGDEDNSPEAPTAPVGSEYDEMIVEIRNYIAFQASHDGQATTDELLNEFKGKLGTNKNVVFRSMLNRICTFHRGPAGDGVWTLKPDFR